MKLLIQQKAYSWSGKCAIGKQWADMFTVRNEFGEIIFTVSELFFSPKRNLRVYNAEGQEIASIYRKGLLFPHTLIDIGGNIHKFYRKQRLFKHAYYLTETSWQIDGGFLEQGSSFAPGGPGAHDYTVSGNGVLIMSMSKRLNIWDSGNYKMENWHDTLGDSYELDIPDPKNTLMCLCLMLSVYSIMADMSSRGHYR